MSGRDERTVMGRRRSDEATPAIEATAEWRGGYATAVRMRDHVVMVDEPVADGGGDAGAMPTELLCASLASCMCMAIAHVARKHDVELPDLTVVVRAERAGRALRYGRFDVTARSSLPEERMRPLLTRAQRFCWVSNTLAVPPAIELSYEPATDTTEVS